MYRWIYVFRFLLCFSKTAFLNASFKTSWFQIICVEITNSLEFWGRWFFFYFSHFYWTVRFSCSTWVTFSNTFFFSNIKCISLTFQNMLEILIFQNLLGVSLGWFVLLILQSVLYEKSLSSHLFFRWHPYEIYRIIINFFLYIFVL